MRVESLPPLSWKASRFNALVERNDGTLSIFNSYMGAFARIPAEEARSVRHALDSGVVGLPNGVLAELCLNGFFVESQVDELARADDLFAREHEESVNRLQLILLPNEQCNFRCKYCAQTFARKKMSRDVIEGVVSYVTRRAPQLDQLTVGWFGGEPLTAPEIIDEIAGRLQDVCREHGVLYRTSSMTTNAYLLTPAVADMLLRREVRGFQITLDGLPEHHDQLRVLGNGKGTFDRILTNLRHLRGRPDDFKVVLRVNFNPDSLGGMTEFLDLVQAEFANDERFCTDFHPVGKWGGPNDASLSVCGLDEGRHHAIALNGEAISRGINPDGLRGKLRRGGSKCYAARPYSFVIGSDGTVYKCTVAFDDPRNQIGRITADGELLVDEEKHALWISTGAEKDSGCRSCFFSPACQGNACPLHRMDSGHRSCPTIKTNITDVLHALSGSCAAHHEQPGAGRAETAELA